MSREKFGAKQSSTFAASAVYAILRDNGYRPKLVNPDRPLHSLNWNSVKTDRNVVNSNSGDSIHMVNDTGALFVLKKKGMMSESSLSYIRKHTPIQLKPSP